MQGHDLTYSKLGSFFCDCGAKKNGNCKVKPHPYLSHPLLTISYSFCHKTSRLWLSARVHLMTSRGPPNLHHFRTPQLATALAVEGGRERRSSSCPRSSHQWTNLVAVAR